MAVYINNVAIPVNPGQIDDGPRLRLNPAAEINHGLHDRGFFARKFYRVRKFTRRILKNKKPDNNMNNPAEHLREVIKPIDVHNAFNALPDECIEVVNYEQVRSLLAKSNISSGVIEAVCKVPLETINDLLQQHSVEDIKWVEAFEEVAPGEFVPKKTKKVKSKPAVPAVYSNAVNIPAVTATKDIMEKRKVKKQVKVDCEAVVLSDGENNVRISDKTGQVFVTGKGEFDPSKVNISLATMHKWISQETLVDVKVGEETQVIEPARFIPPQLLRPAEEAVVGSKGGIQVFDKVTSRKLDGQGLSKVAAEIFDNIPIEERFVMATDKLRITPASRKRSLYRDAVSQVVDKDIYWYLKIKYFLKERTPTMINQLVADARVYLTKQNKALNTEEEYKMISAAILAVWLPSEEELRFRAAAKNKVVLDGIHAINELARGNLGRAARVFNPTPKSGGNKLLKTDVAYVPKP